MIPIGDNVRSRTFPYVNLTFIAINVLVFLYELTLSTTPLGATGLSELDRFFFDWGSIPACLVDWAGRAPDVRPRDLAFACPSGNDVVATPFTSTFVHGGWLHLIGNMVFLWVFGDNVEDALGHMRYAVFYIIASLVATAAHTVVYQNDLVPAVGASGAIAGVLGAYLVLYPRARVTAILFWFPFYVPAVVLIGMWFVLQLLSGIAGLAATDVVGGGGGVAWFAHVGGFLAGVVLVWPFILGRPRRPTLSAVRRRSTRSPP